jgi:hypothetical protein
MVNMMVNRPVKFFASDSYTFGLACDTRLHAECIILKCIRGYNSGLIGRSQKQNSRYTTASDGYFFYKILLMLINSTNWHNSSI